MFLLRCDFRLRARCFAISQTFNPKLLEAVQVVMDALQVAPKVLRQFRCAPACVIQPDDACP